MHRAIYRGIRLLFLSMIMLSVNSCAHGYEIIDIGDLSVLPEKRQMKVAHHEAAHAIARAHYFGPEYLKVIKVHVLCCGGGLEDHLGVVEVILPEEVRTRELERTRIVELLAGSAADAYFLDRKEGTGGTDWNKAKVYAWRIYLRYPDKTGKVPKYTMIAAPQSMYAMVDAEMKEGRKHADEFVRANSRLIQDLADFLMRQNITGHSRQLTQEQFIRFMNGRETFDPRAQE